MRRPHHVSPVSLQCNDASAVVFGDIFYSPKRERPLVAFRALGYGDITISGLTAVSASSISFSPNSVGTEMATRQVGNPQGRPQVIMKPC